MRAQGIRRTVGTAGTGREDSRGCSDVPSKCWQAHSWSPWKRNNNNNKKHLHACGSISLVLVSSGGRSPRVLLWVVAIETDPAA